MRLMTPVDQKQLQQQCKAAKHNLPEATREVHAYRRHLEQRFGVPIEVKPAPRSVGVGATTIPVWHQTGTDNHHSVFVEACEPAHLPYALAQSYAQIELDCVAHEAGVWRCALRSRAAAKYILEELYEPLLATTADQAQRERLRRRADWVIRAFALRVSATPNHLAVARHLHDRFPVLRPAQFVSVNESAVLKRDELVDLQAPPQVLDALHALVVCSKFFFDDLLKTRYLDCHRGPGRSKGEQLFREALRHLAASEPDAHLSLAQRFAEVLGFPDLLIWNSKPVREIISKLRPEMN